jgi:HPr kinase/phosphorylase
VKSLGPDKKRSRAPREQPAPPAGEDWSFGRAKRLSVAEFYENHQEELSLALLTKVSDGPLPITQSETNRPGLLLAGYSESFLNERIQILGEVEQSYLSSLGPEDRRVAIERLFVRKVPMVIITHALPADPFIIEAADRASVPVFSTALGTSAFQHHLATILEEVFAPEISVHGSLVDVYGVGLLFTGRSCIGKSECALDLVERGHRLVADDVVTIKRVHDNILIGTGNELLTHHVEIRGLGIVDVQAIFGIRAIRGQKRVEVEVNLRDWDSAEDYERLGLEGKKSRILGVEIPLVEVPIFPGKNITVISEVISLNYLVKAYGHDPAQAFSSRLMEHMQRKLQFQAIARGDRE